MLFPENINSQIQTAIVRAQDFQSLRSPTNFTYTSPTQYPWRFSDSLE